MTHITDWQAFIAQYTLSVLFTAGYFTIVILMLTGYMAVPQGALAAFVALLGVLTAGMGTILAYWFSRQRQTAEPANPNG